MLPKLFWPTVWINFSSDLKIFANSRPSVSNFKSFSRSLEEFILTVGQNNFGKQMPFLPEMISTYYFLNSSGIVLTSESIKKNSRWYKTNVTNSSFFVFVLFQVDPANIEGLTSRLEQKDKEICALKQAAKVNNNNKILGNLLMHPSPYLEKIILANPDFRPKFFLP